MSDTKAMNKELKNAARQAFEDHELIEPMWPIWQAAWSAAQVASRADAGTAGAKTHRALRMARDCMEANGLGAYKVPRVFAIIDDAIAATPASSVADAAGASEPFEEAFQLVFDAYSKPRDKFNTDEQWALFIYHKIIKAVTPMQKVRALLAAGASERADAEDEPDSIFCSSCGLTRGDSNLLHSIHSGRRKAVSSKLFDSLQERADAEKGAALTDDEISTVWVQVTGAYASDCPWDIHGFARAILAANGEKK